MTEAKIANLNEGIIQNLAQLCANQEYLAMTKLTALMDRASRKRKYEESLAEYRKKKSFGVVMTSTEYVFLQVEGDSVVKSDLVAIHHSRAKKTPEENAAFDIQVERILRMMVSVIQSAMIEAGIQ